MAVGYRSANPFGGGVGPTEPFDIWGAAHSALPDYFPAPQPKAAETAQVVQQAKDRGAAAVAAQGREGPAAPKSQAEPFAADWTGKEGFRWKAQPVTTQSRGEAQAGYQGTHDPYATRDPFGGGSSAGPAPDGMKTLFSAAGTAGQAEADAAAEAGINARHRAALEAIAVDEAMRPDPMTEAVNRAQGNAKFAQANVYAQDPFAEKRFETDEAVRAERGRAGVRQGTMDTYLASVQKEIADAQKASARLAGLPPQEREAKQQQIQEALSQRIAALETAHGFRKVTERATEGSPF